MVTLEKRHDHARDTLTALENFIAIKEEFYHLLKQWGRIDEQSAYEYMRDIAVTRFHVSLDALWKYLQNYLLIHYGLNEASPKGIFRAFFRLGLLTEEQTEEALIMVDARNKAAHVYKEEIADIVFKSIESYARLMRYCIDTLSSSKT